MKKNENNNKKTSTAIIDLLTSMWQQTRPLFQRPHLKNIIIACSLQFGIFATSNGMYMWFPDILNKMVEFIEANPNNYTTICEINNARRLNENSTKVKSHFSNFVPLIFLNRNFHR